MTRHIQLHLLTGSLLLLLLTGCGGHIVVRSTTSTDKVWKAEVVAVKRPPLGTFDGELWVTRDSKRVARIVLFGGRDEVQDVESEIKGLEIIGSNVVVTTRGTFGRSRIEHPLK